jgi:hypothetical protein
MPRTTKKQALAVPAAAAPLSEAELHDLIAKRAYEISCQRAAWAGDELSDWLNAEREVLAELAGPLPDNVVSLAKRTPRSAAAKAPRRQAASTARPRRPKDKLT